MKLNKAFLGLGVMAFALASCSDEVEYTPAAPVTVPAAYFSAQEETVFDIEESDDHVNFKVYRAQGGAAQDVSIDITIRTEDGSAMPADLFDYTPVAHFEEGSCLATIPVSFDYHNLSPTLSYLFDCSVPGEDTQYFLTKVTYDLSYTPWETIEDCRLWDNTAMAPFGGGSNIWSVNVQEHPIKRGFFRVRSPYKDSDYFGSYYNLPDDDPHYLYINATNPSEAFFSDAKGNPVTKYNTGVYCEAGNGFAETYGYIELECLYSHFLLEENLVNGSQNLSYDQFAAYAGKYIVNEARGTAKIKFNEGLFSMLGALNMGAQGEEWELWLNGADDNEDWSDLGMATYTDGFIGQYFKFGALTYQVPIQESIKEPGVYRLIGPYSNNWWQFGNQESADLKLIINCSDPEFVIVAPQTALIDEYGEYELTNADYIYTNQFLKDTPVISKEEVIAQGLNDTFDEATGTININHPAFVEYGEKNGIVYLLWAEKPNVWDTPAKVVLPAQGEGGNGIAPKASAPVNNAPKVARFNKTFKQVYKAK